MEEKLSLKNFHDLIDPVIVDRGEEYFDNGLVKDLQKVAPGLWLAQVQGTENYEVSIRTNRTVIKDWDCNCPYDYGPVCKHVVAVLCEMADRELTGDAKLNTASEAKQTKKKKKRKTQREQFSEIFKKAGKQDLKSFIQKRLEMDTSLRYSFLAYFADLLEEDLLLKYKRMVRNYIQAASDSYGFIDYDGSFEFADNINNLVEKAKSLLEKGKVTESIAICQAVIDGLAGTLESIDDSNGLAGSQIDQSFEILAEAINLIEAPLMKDELFKYCLKQYPKEKYSNFELDLRFLYLMPALISTGEQEMQFMELIDNAIKQEESDLYSDWKVSILLEQKIEYFRRHGRETEADKVIQSGLAYPDIRKLLVEKLVNSKSYNEAKEVITEGIALAEKLEHSGTVREWMDELLKVAEKEKDKEAIRQLTRQLLLDSDSGYMPYYKKLKAATAREAWEVEVNDLLESIKGPEERGTYTDLFKMADVFVAENYWPRLFKLMQINPQSFNFIMNYASHLPARYGSEMPELLLPGLKNMAEPTGRNKYKALVRNLKKVMKLPGGESAVRQAVSWAAETYTNRPAMLEELGMTFPRFMHSEKTEPLKRNTSKQTSIFND